MTEVVLRADKWLWYARFFKTRSLATKACNAGKLRISGELVSKAHHGVKPGDVLTFLQGRHVRVVKVLVLAQRPASKAACPRSPASGPPARGCPAPDGRPSRTAGRLTSCAGSPERRPYLHSIIGAGRFLFSQHLDS